MAKILVVEDDIELQSMISQSLMFEHYTVETSGDGEEACAMLRAREYDLIILDWDLPHVSGVEICKLYRSLRGKLPVLMLTGKKTIADKIEGLDSGADDYMTKPFSLDELMARVRAHLRRGKAEVSSNLLIVQDIVLEPNNYLVKQAGIEVKLVRKEFAILELMMRYPGKVFTAESIIDRIWEQSEYPAPDVVRTHIMNLRRKLTGSIIETVHGVGYKIKSE